MKIKYNDRDADAPNGTTYYTNLEFSSNSLSSIWIFGLEEKGVYKTASNVLSATLHELTHATHCLFVGFTKYVQTDLIIREALALAGQWVLTKDEYKTIDRTSNNAYDDLLSLIECQDWPYTKSKNEGRRWKRNIKYSPLIIDMIDDKNQAKENRPLDDNVTGFSLYSIQRSMHEIQSVDDFENYVTHGRTGNISLDSYFTQFKKYNK